MSLADSGAAFEQHCKRVSHDGALYNLLVNHRINSLSALAFAVGTPQSPPSEDQFKEFATGINAGTDMTFGELAALRRLHFEASAIVMAKLKSRATDTTESARKLPIAEKIARLQEQEGRLAGLRIRGELQQSFALIDMIAQMRETNCVIWIAPSRCSKRDSEIQNSMKEKPITLSSLEQQMVKLASADENVSVDTSTDLQLQWALQRRGLAFDQCALISYNEHEVWVQQLLGHLTREAPTGFARVSTSQVIRADREMFTIMKAFNEIESAIYELRSVSVSLLCGIVDCLLVCVLCDPHLLVPAFLRYRLRWPPC